ncbi:hypothetical protein NDU88_000091 [Pleurodeles waltl]|uniref:Uncharacterized protein n=1 Tax=Pleurodeles waltl TaxID=8319 RepID=A0AAV7SVD7_PLEWA|nr:hypothetical protein NDU88_000091 [Pleurodeles waltl]
MGQEWGITRGGGGGALSTARTTRDTSHRSSVSPLRRRRYSPFWALNSHKGAAWERVHGPGSCGVQGCPGAPSSSSPLTAERPRLRGELGSDTGKQNSNIQNVENAGYTE